MSLLKYSLEQLSETLSRSQRSPRSAQTPGRRLQVAGCYASALIEFILGCSRRRRKLIKANLKPYAVSLQAGEGTIDRSRSKLWERLGYMCTVKHVIWRGCLCQSQEVGGHCFFTLLNEFPPSVLHPRHYTSIILHFITAETCMDFQTGTQQMPGQ